MVSAVMVAVQLDTTRLRERLEELRKRQIPAARQRIVLDVAREVGQRVVVLNPVDTGRSRSAWVAALGELGGVPPADWSGPHPDAAAIGEGAARGMAAVEERVDETEVRLVNEVPYITHLEYGTRAMAPRGMVRRALAEACARPRTLNLEN